MKRQDGYCVETREINIKRMLWWILRKWRVGAAFAIVCAVIFGAWQYKREEQIHEENYQEAIAAQNQAAESVESLTDQLSDAELGGVNMAVYYQTKLISASNYLGNSVLMQLNPYAENVMNIYAECVSEEEAINVMNYLSSEDFLNELVSVVGWYREKSYLKELIEPEMAGNNVKISVIADSVSNAELYANNIVALLNSYHSEEVIYVYLEAETVVDMSAVETFNSVYDSYITNNSFFSNYYNTLNAKQLQLYNLLISGQSSVEEDSIIITLEETKINFKMIVMGFLAGIIAAAVILGVVYTFSARIHGEEEAKYLFGEPVIGNVNAGGLERKRLFGFVDRAVYKLGNRTAKRIDYDGQLQMCIANISLMCQAKDVKEIYLSGSEIGRLPEKLLTDIKEGLSAENIGVFSGGSIVYDADSLKESAEKNNLIFIEISEKSACKEIAKELNLCLQNQLNCLGIIMVE